MDRNKLPWSTQPRLRTKVTKNVFWTIVFFAASFVAAVLILIR